MLVNQNYKFSPPSQAKVPSQRNKINLLASYPSDEELSYKKSNIMKNQR